jgi:hypothetical protein
VYVKNMAQLDKNDLVQMNEDYFKSLEKERLVEVAKNLHQLATDLWEKQQQNSENSSQPPSLDHPYTSKLTTKESNHCSESEFSESATEQNQRDKSSGKEKKEKSKRKPGKQPGGQGFGRSQPLLAEVIIPHHPSTCSACNHDLSELDSQRYMGYYVLELEPELFNQKAAQIGQWILDDLKELIAKIAEESEDNRLIRKRMAGLRRVCHLGKKADHTKLQALAKEILNDWDAVVAFVHHPELPPTNNEAERALRHAVIARRIGFGTRTSEGSLAYSSLLSVIETCRLRQINPWIYIAQVLALARKGINSPPFPLGS